MRLSKEHKRILLALGEVESDFEQIEEATTKTKYTLVNKHGRMRIGIRKAIALLGIEDFLSGISRSAFHWTASRHVRGTNDIIGFNSAKLFGGK